MPNIVILALPSLALRSLGSPSAQWQDPAFNRGFAREDKDSFPSAQLDTKKKKRLAYMNR